MLTSKMRSDNYTILKHSKLYIISLTLFPDFFSKHELNFIVKKSNTSWRYLLGDTICE